MSILKTHEQFLTDLEIKQPELYNSIKIIGKYKASSKLMLIKTKYGNCLVTPSNLLQGCSPSIITAINKTEYFINEIKDKYPNTFFNVKIVGEYLNNHTKILVETKYGNCLVNPLNLLQGNSPTIRTATNKTAYFISQSKEVHGDLYDYSLVNYIDTYTKIKIISSEGVFEQRPKNHLCGKGCPLLAKESLKKYHRENPANLHKDTDYINKGLKSKHFDSFKVYILKCWNNDKTEVFYKIGKTFLTVKERFRSKKMPYNYEIISTFEFDKTFEGGKECSELERKLQYKHKEFKYVPKIEFGGMHECFLDSCNLSF